MRPWNPLRRLRRTSRGEHDRTTSATAVVDALIAAWDSSSTQRLSRVLTRGAALTIDTGGRGSDPTGTVTGRTAVVTALLRLRDAHPHPVFARGEVNGAAGVVVHSQERVVAVICLSIGDHAIEELWAVVNPEKLTHWNAG